MAIFEAECIGRGWVEIHGRGVRSAGAEEPPDPAAGGWNVPSVRGPCRSWHVRKHRVPAFSLTQSAP